MPKRELTVEEKEECARLKALWESWKARTRQTQEFAADYLGFRTQGAVSQYLNGKIALNLPISIKWAQLLGCQVADFSQRLAAQLPTDTPSKVVEPQPTYRLLPVEVWDDDTPVDDDTVELPLYKSAEFAAGVGRSAQVEIDEGHRLRYGRRTLRKAGVDPANAAGGINKGNSNEPVIPDGAVVMVDRSKTEIIAGELYGIDHLGEFRAKLLYPLPGGGLRVRSYNREEYPDEDYGPDWPTFIRIIGWVWIHQPPVRRWRGR